MSFVYPNFLWALLFTAVPIIIHLFYFRRYKKVYFSNTKFLSEVKDERSSRNKLKHLLVLLTRILAIISLVFAFAQPFNNNNNSNNKIGDKHVSIYIDNSFSMKAEGTGQLLFDEAKVLSKNIVNSFSENDKFQILTNDFKGKHQRLVNKTEALSFIDDLEISSAIRSSKSVFARQKTIFTNKSVENIVFQLSDFQKNNQLLDPDSSISISIVKLSVDEVRNIYIDSLWLDNSFQLVGASNKMIVRFRNESDEENKGTYQFVLNEEVKSVGKYLIPQNGFSYDTLVFNINKTGWNSGKIQISDYPITYDDVFYFSFSVQEKVNVLKIHDTKNDHTFNAIFKEIANVNFKETNYKKLDYTKLNVYDFLIVDKIKTIPTGFAQSLKQYVKMGGSILVIPHKDITFDSYNTLFANMKIGTFKNANTNKREISKINLKHNVFDDLFISKPKNIKLPTVFKNYVLRTNMNSSEQQILSFINKETYLSSFTFGSGNVFILTAPLEKKFSDFSSNAIFAPVVYKMAVMSVSNSHLSFEINATTSVVLRNKPTNYEDVIKMKIGNFETIPQKNIFNEVLTLNLLNSNVKAGIYEVFNDKKDFSAKVALNYSRKESELEYYSEEELKNKYSNTNVNIFSGDFSKLQEKIFINKKGNALWKLFIVFVLLFLMFEILLLRMLKA